MRRTIPKYGRSVLYMHRQKIRAVILPIINPTLWRPLLRATNPPPAPVPALETHPRRWPYPYALGATCPISATLPVLAMFAWNHIAKENRIGRSTFSFLVATCTV